MDVVTTLFRRFISSALFLFQIKLVYGVTEINGASTCIEPNSYGSMNVSLYADTIFQQTYTLLPVTPETSQIKTLSSVQQRFINITSETIQGHANCHSKRHIPRNNNLRKFRHHSASKLSICKWNFIRNIDPNRRPEVLIEAVCACPSPANSRGLSCYPVTQYVMVYRRTGCVLGVYVYEKIWEPVRIACVAGRRVRITKLQGKTRMPI